MTKLTEHIMFFYRICNKLHSRTINKETSIKKFLITLMIKVLNNYYRLLLSLVYGAYLPYTAKLGKDIKFPHGLFGIFISMNAEIGDECTIFHHVTIGSSKEFSPQIGNNVSIGCNSCIIGKCIIGNHCQIGAGTTIANAEIPDNSIVVGSKFIIKKQLEEINEHSA